MRKSSSYLKLLVGLVSVLAFPLGVKAERRLYIVDVDVRGGTIYLPGQSIYLHCEVQDADGRPTDSFGTYTVYFYAVHYQSNSEYQLGSTVRTPAPGSDRDLFDITGAFPEDVPERSYAVTAEVVYTEGGEQRKNRWWTSRTVRVLIPSPNLAVQSVDAMDGYYRPGDEIAVNVIVKNFGELDSGGFSIDCFAGKDAGTLTGGFGIGSAASGAVGPGQQSTVSFTGTLPTAISAGEYYIQAVVACGGDDDLRNNTGYDPIRIAVGPFADLTIQSVDVTPGTYRPGDTMVVRALLKNAGESVSPAYTVRYYVSADAGVTAYDYTIGSADCAGLARGQQQSLTTICQLPSYLPKGSCYIGAIVTCPREANPRNNVAFDNEAVELVHPAEYVCGQASYDDTSGWNHPIRYALAKIYDTNGSADLTDDCTIGETYTDAEGNYGVRLTSNGASHPDIYVRVFTEGVSGACPGTTSKICAVKDHVLKQLFSIRSINYPYPSTGSVTIPVLSPRTSTAGGFLVYDSVVEGFEKTRQFFNVELPEITTYWPTSDGQTYYVPGEGIFVSMDDRGDRDVILHEYGHYLADSCGFALGSVGLNPIHYWNLDLRIRPTNRNNKEARNLAFREAWATLFGIAVQFGETGYPYAGNSKYEDVDEITRNALVLDLEGGTAAHRTPGEYYEYMNCCALWDIFDDNCDIADDNDTLCDPKLTRIWAVATEFEPNDMLDFWNGWFARLGGVKEFNRIIWDHGMSFKAPVPTPAIETFETGDFSAFAWTSGSPSWAIAPGAGCQGSYGAQAAAIGNNQSVTLEITMDCDDGWIYFWVKTSCEQFWDPLRFSIDGVKKDEWSGQTDWQRVAFPVRGGNRKFTWAYIRDAGGAGGADTAWIDDIEFPLW